MGESPHNISSKNPQRRGSNEFYRYYAGYPIDFAEWAIGKLAVAPDAMIFDPWNGSGTTIAACAKLGLSCKGYDINPVMVHLARARIASADDLKEAQEIIDQVESAIENQHKISILELGRALKDIPVPNETAHSAVIAALFPKASEIYGFSRSKNPSWYSANGRSIPNTLDSSQIISEWKSLLADLSSWSTASEEQGGVLTVERADTRKSLGRKQMFDGLLTSPPYLTRIDYVHATLPEFTLLCDFDIAPDKTKLRRSMLGTPLTAPDRHNDLSRLPSSVIGILNQIACHPSKASATYYLNFFSAYFVDLSASFRNISRALKDGAKGCVVVQPTSYKEVIIQLDELVVDIAASVGLNHVETVTFATSKSMALVNSKAHEHARTPKSEFAVFFRK